VAEQRRRAEAVALPARDVLPLQRTRPPRERRLPSARSLIVGLVLVAAAAGAYLLARESSVFAVRSIRVEGVDPQLTARVREALRPLVGASLVSLDRGAAARRALALPEIASATVDRAFPHTLRITVEAEHPVAVMRQADLAWLASAEGRVLQQLNARPYPALPRIWLPRKDDVLVGATLSGAPAEALRAVAPLGAIHFPLPVRSAQAGDRELTLTLGSGLEIRLGDLSDLRLKLAVAARIVSAAAGARYVDVTVPERAVAAYDSQVGG
jgi:cell division protein FtsQ